ncbi:uncharacterized protein LOC129594313 [Paramacrobiotus metropolitanus]|uniref:uncharacterized protein LOC129594313 n=1 Tax=Paramacrobiotus metropolitanus TaxID=2943436 RepID=UPI0024462EA8|nr:uncharacterized protein LOC129594313 [Paramacrobiotus metropolitanus]
MINVISCSTTNFFLALFSLFILRNVFCKSILSAVDNDRISLTVKRDAGSPLTKPAKPNSNDTGTSLQHNGLKDLLEKFDLMIENARGNGTGAVGTRSALDKQTRWWGNDNSNNNNNDNTDKEDGVLHENGYHSWQGYYSRIGSPGTEKKPQSPSSDPEKGPQDRPLY